MVLRRQAQYPRIETFEFGLQCVPVMFVCKKKGIS